MINEKQLGDSWFKDEITSSLAEVEIDWVESDNNEGENGIIMIEFNTPEGIKKLD
jgi:hypothetical protein